VGHDIREHFLHLRLPSLGSLMGSFLGDPRSLRGVSILSMLMPMAYGALQACPPHLCCLARQGRKRQLEHLPVAPQQPETVALPKGWFQWRQQLSNGTIGDTKVNLDALHVAPNLVCRPMRVGNTQDPHLRS
jgi:hypothetical protein